MNDIRVLVFSEEGIGSIVEKNRRSLKFGAEPELISQPSVSDKLRVMRKSLKITFPTYYQFSLIIFEEQVGDVVALG